MLGGLTCGPAGEEGQVRRFLESPTHQPVMEAQEIQPLSILIPVRCKQFVFFFFCFCCLCVCVCSFIHILPQVLIYAALRRAADTTFDGRSRGQVMADTLIERVTGRPAESATPIAVNLVLSDDTLLGGDSTAATISGTGRSPPRSRADSWAPPPRTGNREPPCAGSIGIRGQALWWRWSRAADCSPRDWPDSSTYAMTPAERPTATPQSGTTTTPSRTPAVVAPAPDNGLGTCAACNYTKEAPGWRVSTSTDENGSHTAEFTTPTRARQHSKAPALPGPVTITVSKLETRIGISIARHAA